MEEGSSGHDYYMKKWGLWKTVSAFLMVLHTYVVTTVFNFWKRSLSGCATVSAFLTVSQRFSKNPTFSYSMRWGPGPEARAYNRGVVRISRFKRFRTA
jgi:hypothetical protein